VNARGVQRCFGSAGRVGKLVQMSALWVAASDCGSSGLRIERMHPSLTAAGSEPAGTSPAAIIAWQ